MKTKTFFILCLLSGIGLTQLSGQNGQNGNGTDSFFWDWDINHEYGPYWIDIPVNCDNNVVDRLLGEVTVHQINHYKRGEQVWVKQQFDGEVKSALTDEVFKVKEILKAETPLFIWYSHVNLIGNKGSHYKFFYSYDGNNDILSFIKAICN
jgi:hypothetical protein